MYKIYENIKKLRQAKGWTQTDLALKVGYSDKSMIAQIEKGKVDLPQSKITAFAKALGVTESTLMGWDGDPSMDVLLTNEEIDLIMEFRKSPHKSAILSLLGLD